MRSPRVARPAHVERLSMLRDGMVAASLRRVGSTPYIEARSGEAAWLRSAEAPPPVPVGREGCGRVRLQRTRALIASLLARCSRLAARLIDAHTPLSRIPRL